MKIPSVRRGPAVPSKVNCTACGTTRGMEFECVPCCVRWLQKMDRATMAINAPVIGVVGGQEHLNKVREAYRAATEYRPLKK